MGDKAWKRLERDVAKYFGTQRRVRGADFGQSDIEILASIKDWLGEPNRSDIGLVVECKYRKNHPIIDIVHEHTRSTGPLGLVHIGSYILCRQDYFIGVWNHIILPWPKLDALRVLSFDNKILDKKVPKYLDEYRAQAVQYTAHAGMTLLPLVCMAQANTKGRVIAVHWSDIDSFAKASYATFKAIHIQDKTSTSKATDRPSTQ